MAMVLDAFASYIQSMLTEIAKEEVRMLFGVSDEIAKVGVTLGDLKNILADAERRRIMDRSVQGWVRELKGAMYDATDILDLYHLKAMEQRESQLPGCIQPLLLGLQNPNFTHLLGQSAEEAIRSLLFSLRDPLFVYNIGSRIKKLNQTLDDIKERSAAFRFISVINPSPYEDRRTADPDADRRKTSPVLGRSGVVGEKIEEDTRALVEKLATENDVSVMVVAILGVGGIGKTTLAGKVFNAQTIKAAFNIKIWLSVTQVFSKAELLRTAIIAANGDIPGAGAGTQEKSLLETALVDIIRDKKFFLVLDDMWDNKVWENLLKVPFSHGAPSSRVLVTTRDEKIARGMRALQPYHHVDKLGREDAWSLLKEQVVSNEADEAEIDVLKDIGLKIASKCDGLPLAVKVMGGLLRQKERNINDWKKVLDDSAWSVSGMPEELNYAIYISYKNMSSCVKQCFLHYSLIPKDKLIHDDIIIGMWINEGFLHEEQLSLARGTKELEEVGRKCYMELIELNLIEPDELYIDQDLCTMHDVVRSFGQYICRDEALVGHIGETSIRSILDSQKFLRLSIENRGSESGELEWSILEAQKSLRTLILIGQLNIKPSDSLIAFSSLWTLHLESANVAPLIDSLDQLKHLRYLSIRCSDLSGLPENIGKMRLLQLINLGGCEALTKLPGSIVKLGQLRYLNLIGTSTEYGIPVQLPGASAGCCGHPAGRVQKDLDGGPFGSSRRRRNALPHWVARPDKMGSLPICTHINMGQLTLITTPT